VIDVEKLGTALGIAVIGQTLGLEIKGLKDLIQRLEENVGDL
tara:strand:+ start:837 stop:962 length:126 start_codon:yes stop_codon:yes gene_type:complete